VEELVNEHGPFSLETRDEEVDELSGDGGVDAGLGRQLLERRRLHALELAQQHRLLGDGERVRVPQQELAERADVLARDVAHLRRRLRPVAQQAADRHLGAGAVLQHFAAEVLDRLLRVVPLTNPALTRLRGLTCTENQKSAFFNAFAEIIPTLYC
jgi:hypothetical protein